MWRFSSSKTSSWKTSHEADDEFALETSAEAAIRAGRGRTRPILAGRERSGNAQGSASVDGSAAGVTCQLHQTSLGLEPSQTLSGCEEGVNFVTGASFSLVLGVAYSCGRRCGQLLRPSAWNPWACGVAARLPTPRLQPRPYVKRQLPLPSQTCGHGESGGRSFGEVTGSERTFVHSPKGTLVVATMRPAHCALRRRGRRASRRLRDSEGPRSRERPRARCERSGEPTFPLPPRQRTPGSRVRPRGVTSPSLALVAALMLQLVELSP